MPNNTQPQITSGVRKTPYDIGGQTPYGFMQTPSYTTLWSPALVPGFQIPEQQEIALYDRMDWQNAYEGYVNPPFIGVGSAGGAVPKFMQGEDGPHRILRGYIRRSFAHPMSEPGLTDDQKATNARLYFMYNPSEFARQYVSYSVLAGQASDQIDNPVNGGQQVPALVSMNLELLFDRQEEVSRFPNHPGCLVDLAVFDMLIGNKATSYDDVMKRDAEAKAGTTATDDTTAVPDTGAPTGSDQSLKPGLDIYLTIIMSPTLVFEGRIMEASALFQKFSHRMTPTRMTITLTLLLNYTGKLLSQGVLSAADQAASALRKDLNTKKEDVDPTKKAESRNAALQLNYNGRILAVQWAEQWTAEAKILANQGPYGPAGTYGSYYAHSKKLDRMFDRCANWQSDDLGDATGTHQPPWFDCSSLCWRSYNVVGWCEALHLSKTCGDASGSFINTASAHGDVWSIDTVQHGFGSTKPSADLLKAACEFFNSWDPENTGQGGPNTGDMLVKKGEGSDGHIAFIHSNISKDSSDPLSWRWKILHSCCPDEPVKYSEYSTQDIVNGGHFHYIIRPHPIKS